MSRRPFRSVMMASAATPAPRRQGLYVLQCGAKDCNNTEQITAGGHLPAQVVRKLFQQRNWTVGRTPRHDRCPGCTARVPAPSPEAEKVVPMVSSTLTVVPAVPRAMEVDDRRIIFAQLNDVYLDGTQGYSAGWSDKRVAEHLNVPRAWVATIREENFGPARDNEDVRELDASILDMQKRIAEFDATLQTANEHMTVLSKLGHTLKSELGALSLKAEKIRKAVA